MSSNPLVYISVVRGVSDVDERLRSLRMPTSLHYMKSKPRIVKKMSLSTTALSNRKPAVAGSSHEHFRAQGHVKRDTIRCACELALYVGLYLVVLLWFFRIKCYILGSETFCLGRGFSRISSANYGCRQPVAHFWTYPFRRCVSWLKSSELWRRLDRRIFTDM